ncbi:hypothetical protein [Xanthomonas arboricola]|uniref:hypothetical protein n=1 Tax=Xanthomonas arboricola TaxID=56448 RepID=UPI0016196CCF|nr:hypothetical protein [Xanthomonas arboricola]MBB3759250.1 DNA-binding MarR family transcriptional regulator [Xanthomonas arboricola]
MSSGMQSKGLAAQLRAGLFHAKDGATSAALQATAAPECTQSQVTRALNAMRGTGLVIRTPDPTGTRWSLTAATRAKVARTLTSDAENTARRSKPAVVPSHTTPSHAVLALSAAQKKAIESARIAQEIADFQAHGGRIEVLGNTPIRRPGGYRQSMSGIATA